MNTGSGSPGDDPIRVLADQESETSAEFVAAVRRRIHRRMTASQFAAFSWHLPKAVLAEMGGLLRHLFTTVGGRKDSRS